MVHFSAPGSVVLSGEYGLLFGKPAIAAAIDARIDIGFTNSKKKDRLDDISLFVINETKRYLQDRNLFALNKWYPLRVVNAIPEDDTFGYIDAKITALIALVIYAYSKRKFASEEIPSIAYSIEKKINHTSLGIHCTASCLGGLIYYRREFEFLKHISSLNIRIPDVIEKHLFFVDTGKAEESDGELENLVGKAFNVSTKRTEAIFQEMEKTTKRLTVSIAKEDGSFFKECLKLNEGLLEKLGVVSGYTRKIIRNLEQIGSAKIIGNGGKKKKSGFLLVYSKDENELKKITNTYNISYFPFHQSAKGLVRNTL